MNEPVHATRRKPLTYRQRIAMHDVHGGICVVCQEPIAVGEPFIDEHVIPLEIGGSNDASNRGPAHIPCAKIKTKRDQAIIARTLRARARHLGIKRKPKGRPMPGGRNSPWRKKINGEVVRR